MSCFITHSEFGGPWVVAVCEGDRASGVLATRALWAGSRGFRSREGVRGLKFRVGVEEGEGLRV